VGQGQVGSAATLALDSPVRAGLAVTQVPVAHQEGLVRVDLAVTRQRVLGQVATLVILDRD